MVLIVLGVFPLFLYHQSEFVVPDAEIEHDWAGMNVVRLPKCEHGWHAILKRAWGGKHVGRCFWLPTEG